MDGGLAESANLVEEEEEGEEEEEEEVGFFGDVVGVSQAEVGVGDDLDLGSQLVAEPADADVVDGLHTGHRGDDAVDVVDEVGFDAVHEPPVDVAYGAPEDEEDGDGDEQADDRVGEGPAGEDAEGAGDDGEGGEPVGAGVLAVGDEAGDPILLPTRMR